VRTGLSRLTTSFDPCGHAACAEADPVLIRKALPGDPDDKASRCIEAAVDAVLFACLYLPNGNPQTGPRFVCKLDQFDRLIEHARTLKKSASPVVLL
jgi:exodeoxyribonuclease-3